MTLAFVSILFFSPQLSAQPDRTRCPDLESSASAAEQALCWFRSDDRGATACQNESDGVNICLLNAVSWCTDATIETSSVANACFLSYVRSADFDSAISIAEHLSSPSVQAPACLKALSATTLNIRTMPSGAEIEIEGRSYGRAPVTVELSSNWRKTQISARFITDSGEEPVQILVPSQELVDLMDRRACVMGDLIIKEKKDAEPALLPTPDLPQPSEPPSIDEPGESAAPPNAETQKEIEEKTPLSTPKESKTPSPPKDGDQGLYIAGIILTGLGAAGIVTGSVLFVIAASRSSDLANAEPGTAWTDELQHDYDTVTEFRVGGGIAMQIGAILSGVGIVFLLSDGSDEDKNQNAQIKLSPKGTGATLRWRF